jgi:hypothetical protein
MDFGVSQNFPGCLSDLWQNFEAWGFEMLRVGKERRRRVHFLVARVYKFWQAETWKDSVEGVGEAVVESSE